MENKLTLFHLILNLVTATGLYNGSPCDDFCKAVNSTDLYPCVDSPLESECEELCRTNKDCICFSENEVNHWSLECELHAPFPKKYDILECDTFCKSSNTTEPTPCSEVKDKDDDPLEHRCKYICKENAACKCRSTYHLNCPYKTVWQDCYDHCVRDGHLIPDKCGQGTECDLLCTFDKDNVCNCSRNDDDNEYEMPCDSYYTQIDDCYKFCLAADLDRATKCDSLTKEQDKELCNRLCDRDKTNFCECLKSPDGNYEIPCPYERLKMPNCSQFCEKRKVSGTQACESIEDKEFRRQCHFICQTSSECACDKTNSTPYEITLTCPGKGDNGGGNLRISEDKLLFTVALSMYYLKYVLATKPT